MQREEGAYARLMLPEVYVAQVGLAEPEVLVDAEDGREQGLRGAVALHAGQGVHQGDEDGVCLRALPQSSK